MRRQYPAALALWTVLAIVGCSDEATLTPEQALAETDALVAALIADDGVPGVAYAVVLDGEVAFVRAHGLREKDNADKPVTEQTFFHLFSVSKSMAAVALLSMADAGKVDFDQPVKTYVSDFELDPPSATPSVTTHHLLTHTSGIPDDNPLTNPGWGRCETSLAEHFASTHHALWIAPGTFYNYSNEGYNLVGAVLENVAQKPFTEAMNSQLFAPLGIDAISYENAVVEKQTYAMPHTREDGVLYAKPLDFHGCPFEYPAMGAMATMPALARYARYLIGGDPTVLSEASYRKLISRYVDEPEDPRKSYGYGLGLSRYKGVEVISHSGRGLGSRAIILVIPERRFAFVAAANSTGGDLPSIAFRAADFFLGLTGSAEADKKTDPQTWTDYNGHYKSNGPLGDIDVIAKPKDAKLTIKVIGLPMSFSQVHQDHFVGQAFGETVHIAFLRDDNGAVRYLVSRAGVGTREVQ